MPPVGFDPTILARERRHIHVLDHAATTNSSKYYDEIRRKRNGVGRTLSRHVKTRNTRYVQSENRGRVISVLSVGESAILKPTGKN